MARLLQVAETSLAVSGWLGDQPVGLSLAGRMTKNHAAYLTVLLSVRRHALLTDS